MLIESYSLKTRPNVDRENSRLNNVVVMSTEFNHNKNATFSRINQDEIVNLGNSGKVACYLGHAKQGATSNDRLPFRLGFYENFRVEDTKVKADLILSPTIETNPVLAARFPAGIKEYIYTLAENESEGCGLSMVVGMVYNEDDSVTIGELYSVDLVEDPALTVALFSKAPHYEEVSPILAESFSQFNYLDDSIKQGKPTAEILDALLATLAFLKGQVEPVQTEQVEEAPQVDSESLEAPIEEQPTQGTVEAETAPEESLEAPIEAEEVATLEPVEPSTSEEVIALESFSKNDDLRAEFAELKEMVKQMQEMFSSKFAKEEIKEDEYKKVTLTFNSPLPISSSNQVSKEEHREEYSRLRQENKIEEAAKYFKKHLM